MAEKSTRTKMLEEAEIKDDPLMLKRALRGAGVGISKLADKAGFTQEEEYKKMEEKKKKRAGGSVSPSKQVLAKSGFYDKGKTKPEREKIVSKVTTKPQRVKMVEKMLSASKRSDGIAKKGKTKGRMV